MVLGTNALVVLGFKVFHSNGTEVPALCKPGESQPSVSVTRVLQVTIEKNVCLGPGRSHKTSRPVAKLYPLEVHSELSDNSIDDDLTEPDLPASSKETTTSQLPRVRRVRVATSEDQGMEWRTWPCPGECTE